MKISMDNEVLTTTCDKATTCDKNEKLQILPPYSPSPFLDNICAVNNKLTTNKPSSQEHYYDALDDQPWLNSPTHIRWKTSLTTTAVAIKNALHYQLIQLSRFSMANDLLNFLPPEISKLLAVTLYCGGHHADVVYQAGILGGLTLVNSLIYNTLGVNTSAIVLASLPHLLLNWLERHQLPLSSQVISVLTCLLHTGLAICASQDLHQPAVLVDLYSQVILPAQALFEDTGFAGTVATGMSLLLCLYSGLRLSGLINSEENRPNYLNQTFAVVRNIYSLADRSFIYEQQKDGLLKRWYQQSLVRIACVDDPQADIYSEERAQKALDRAVNHAISVNLRTNSESESFFLLKKEYEQRILLGQLPAWPARRAPCAIPDIGNTVQDDAPISATYETVNSPLLITTGVIAATTLVPGCRLPGKFTLAAGAAAATALTLVGKMFLEGQHDADNESENIPLSSLLQHKLQNNSLKCQEIIHSTRAFLQSSKTGWPLASDLFNRLFNANGDSNIEQMNLLLHSANITAFSADQRNNINDYLLDTLSVLLASPLTRQAWNIEPFISALNERMSTLWVKPEGVTVKEALIALRLLVAEHYIRLGIVDSSRMAKVTEFILNQIIPAALDFERHEMSSINLQSKPFYYMLNYIGNEIAENKHIVDKDFEKALIEGRKDEFFMARLNSYYSKPIDSDDETLSINLHKKLNQDFYDYHEKDIELESLPMITLDEIIQIEYAKIDIYKKINFDTDKLRINNQGNYNSDINVLRGCTNYRDVIRSFEDGIATLYRYLPGSVPAELRNYNYKDNKSPHVFVLKPHKKLSQLKNAYENANKQARIFYSEKYQQVVDMAIELLEANELIFLRHKDTRIYIIDTEVKRYQFLRYLFLAKPFRLSQDITERIAYNQRPFHESGKFFFGYDIKTKERRYYSLNIEGSRNQPGQFPVQRIDIHQTKALITLPHDFLNENYVFLDERSLFDPCEEVHKPIIKLDSWAKTGGFLSEHLRYYKNILCKTFKNNKEIIVNLKERPIAFNSTDPLASLKEEVIGDRNTLLLFFQQREFKAQLTESEIRKDKGVFNALAENLPFYNCYELFKDNFINDKDDTSFSFTTTLFQSVICGADFYLGYNLKNTLATLFSSSRQNYIRSWVKKAKLSELNKNLKAAYNFPQSSHMRYPVEFEYKLTTLEHEIGHIDAEISLLRSQIQKSLHGLFSTPAFVAFPYLSLRPDRNLKASARPWAFNMSKMGIKKWQAGDRFNNRPSPNLPTKTPLSAPKVTTTTSVQRNRFTCNSPGSPLENVVINIFDIKISHPELYKKLFFSALKTPSSQAIYDELNTENLRLSNQYDKLSMLSFISLTIPIRSYTNQILAFNEQAAHVVSERIPSPNNISEALLNEFYENYELHSANILKDDVLTLEQNLLLNKNMALIADILQSNLLGIEACYTYLVQHLLMSENFLPLLSAQQGTEQEKRDSIAEIDTNLFLKLNQFTVYGSTEYMLQSQFHHAVIKYLGLFIASKVDENAANIILFSPNMQIFTRRLTEMGANNDSILPTNKDFTNNWLQIAANIEEIYLSYARCEYTAKVLAEFNTDQWLSTPVQLAWVSNLQRKLFNEMHFQDLAPFIFEVTTKLRNSWNKRLAQGPINIMLGRTVNSLFIDDVAAAMKDTCEAFSTLLFCQVYLIENGRWFTFLNNDFIHESPNRTQRNAPDRYPSYPLPVALRLDESLPTRQQAADLIEDCAWEVPFHLRLYSSSLELLASQSVNITRKGMPLLNQLITPHGKLVDFQVKTMQHHAFQNELLDDRAVLQMLAEIISLNYPNATRLYDYIFTHLQNTLFSVPLSLAELGGSSFIRKQSIDIYTAYISKIGDIPFEHQQALQRYIAAVLTTLLGFTKYLAHIESVLTDAPLSTITSQWLCLGAIISDQLTVAESSTEALLHLGYSTLFDTGLLPVRLLAHQQLALLSSMQSFMDISQAPQLALNTVAGNIAGLSNLQNTLLACLVADRRLADYSDQWQYDSVKTEVTQLSSLIENSLQEQQRLIDSVFKQLAPAQQTRVLFALKSKQLNIIWYQAEERIVGLALMINGQHHGLLLPFGEPEVVPLAFRQLSKGCTQETLLRLCFGGFETKAKDIQISATIALADNSPTDIALAIKHSLSMETTSLLTLTGETHTEARFSLLKQSIIDWSKQHLFFFARGDAAEIQRIPEITQHLADIASHPDVISWSNYSQRGTVTTESNIDFSLAIARVMQAKTHWPDIAVRLREISVKGGATTFEALPSEGFSGFWWDPVSHFCYLGWLEKGHRLLFASLAEDRESFYALPDNSQYEPIWQSLGTFNNLATDLQALRQGTLTADEFFTDSLPLAWRMECYKESSFPLPEGSLPHPILAGVYYFGEPSRRVYFYCPTNMLLSKACLPIQLVSLEDGSYQINFDTSDKRLSADLHFSLKTALPSANQTLKSASSDWTFIPAARWRLVSSTKSQRLLKRGVIKLESFIEWDNNNLTTSEMQPLPRVLQDVMGNLVYVFSENNNQRISYRILDVEGYLQPSPHIPADWPRMTSDAASDGQTSALQYFDHFFADEIHANTIFPMDDDRRLYLESLLNRFRMARQERQSAIQQSINSGAGIPFYYSQNHSITFELNEFQQQLKSRGQRLDVELQKALDIKLDLSDQTWVIYHWRHMDLYNAQQRSEAHLESNYQKKIFLTLQQLVLSQPHDNDVYSQLLAWITKSLNILEHILNMLDTLNPFTLIHVPTSNYAQALQTYRGNLNNFFSFYSEQPWVTPESFNQPWPFAVVKEDADRRHQLWQPVIIWLQNASENANQILNPLQDFTGLTDDVLHAENLDFHVDHWQRKWNNTLVSWASTNVSQKILLIRPRLSEQGFPLSATKYNWPIKCILSASRNPLQQLDDSYLAPVSQLDPQQIESLVLTATGPSTAGVIDIPLAIAPNTKMTVGDFAQLARQRLSCAFALAELADAAFLWRLQQRIIGVMRNETPRWNSQEAAFYASPETKAYLNETQLDIIDKRKHAQFFKRVYENKALMIRLILSDPQMLFGMLCFNHLQVNPAKATTQVAKAWFLFQHSFSEDQGEQAGGQILLIGV